MKSVQKVFLWILGMTLIFACNSSHHQSDIKLNNGQKWHVNSEMKPHIEKASELFNEYLSKQDKDYQKLATNLKQQNNALIQSCTMKGKSHDELHKWLHPHMGLIEDLANAKDVKESEPIILQLENSFKTYYNYFQ